MLFTACNSNTDHDAQNDSLPATDSMTAMRTDNSKVENDAEKFAQKAAMGGLMEVELGKIAAQKATDPEVKQFAQQMVDDHSKANDELKNIAGTKNIMLPSALDDSHQKDLNDLNEKTGNDFDKEYVKMMVDDHKDDVDEFQKAAEKLDDAELKNFAINTLPTLQKHLASIEKIHDRIK